MISNPVNDFLIFADLLVKNVSGNWAKQRGTDRRTNGEFQKKHHLYLCLVSREKIIRLKQEYDRVGGMETVMAIIAMAYGLYL